jgi:molybdopterin-binding protein
MKLSARNSIKGTVKQLTVGAVSSEVVIEISPGLEVVSIITKSSVETLGVEVGKEVYAVIKSTDIMVAVD